MQLLQLTKICDNIGDAFTALMHELVNKYAGAFTEISKTLAQDISHKTKLLDPAKSIPHHGQQRISGREFQKVQNQLQEYIEKGWIQPGTFHYNQTIFFIHKKTKKLRICIEFSSLNSNTIIDGYCKDAHLYNSWRLPDTLFNNPWCHPES